ncbi:hypothetical protein [Megasphaera elsdenii]|uniref:hypothetical protein n=1 Tax=Megasphaera elsdenii TaxID=907 RepID=UPI001D035718|nr:hypothetical protein [Megasphaera elsdenii]MCB5771335.1 hypothetical protein [Megasphaera elsdenii]
MNGAYNILRKSKQNFDLSNFSRISRFYKRERFNPAFWQLGKTLQQKLAEVEED